MTLTLDLPPELESQLKAEAEASDQTPAQWLVDLAAQELAQREIEDAEDWKTAIHRINNPDPRPNKTLDDLRAHIEVQRSENEKQAHIITVPIGQRKASQKAAR
jgi:hypothetical protein